MDRYERRRLVENEKHLKRMEDITVKFFRTDKHIREKRRIYEALRDYTPRFVSLIWDTNDSDAVLRYAYIDGDPVNIWMHDLPPGGPYYWLYRKPQPLLSRLKDEIEHPRYRIVDEVDYAWDPLHKHILVEESIAKLQRQLDVETLQTHGPSFFRTTERNRQLRADHMGGYARMQAILRCKQIKEDLMAAVWHPRRVGHILETYGWEAYENLLVE